MERALILVGDYSSLASEGIVRWYDDDYDTPGDPIGLATEIAYLTRPGYRIGNVFLGDDRGRIFMEDPDDIVPFVGETIIVPAHLELGDVGGDDDEGKQITRHWSYVESEQSDWLVRIWTGDERAYPPFEDLNLIRSIKPDGGDTVAASEILDVYPKPPDTAVYDTKAQPKTVHIHKSEREISGRGFTFEFRFRDPLGIRFYGFGFVAEPGRTRRPIVEATRVAPIAE